MLEWRATPTPGAGKVLRWHPLGPVLVGTSPLRVACPVESCKAAIGEHCRRPRPRRGRVRCTTHPRRIERAAEQVTEDEQGSPAQRRTVTA